jgi:hypothetical protein
VAVPTMEPEDGLSLHARAAREQRGHEEEDEQ